MPGGPVIRISFGEGPLNMVFTYGVRAKIQDLRKEIMAA